MRQGRDQEFTISQTGVGRYLLSTVTGGLEFHPDNGYERAYAVSRGTLKEWQITPVITGPVSLTDKVGLALDVEGESGSSGAKVIGWAETGRPNQVWAAQINGPGGYELKNQWSSMCLDDGGGLVVQRTCDHSAAQSWEAVRRGNDIVLRTIHGYLTFDAGPGIVRAAVNSDPGSATAWNITAR